MLNLSNLLPKFVVRPISCANCLRLLPAEHFSWSRFLWALSTFEEYFITTVCISIPEGFRLAGRAAVYSPNTCDSRSFFFKSLSYLTSKTLFFKGMADPFQIVHNWVRWSRKFLAPLPHLFKGVESLDRLCSTCLLI